MFEHRDTFDPSGTRAAIAKEFSERATIARVLKIEETLARVQAEYGLIPIRAAAEISRQAKPELVSSDAIARQLVRVGHPMVAILDAWSENIQPDAAEWIHFGTTTADIIRTVQFMQLRDVASRLIAAMNEIETRLIVLARRHKDTPMVGRTLGRHGLPITFGLKVAVWFSENRRNLERLRAWVSRTRGGVLSGALGTYSLLGPQCFEIEARVMHELGLGAPETVDIKGSFDRYADFGAVLAIAARTYGRIAQEIFLLQGDDIRELEEAANGVGSSTMPHKANPTLSIEIVSRAREISAMLPVLFDWMMVIYERDSAHHDGALERMCVETGQVVSCMIALLDRLRVNPENMRRNLGRTRGLIMTEALTQRLAGHMGRRSAHHVMHKVAQEAIEHNDSLFACLRTHPDISGILGELDENSLDTFYGFAPEVVSRALSELGISDS